MILRIVWLPTRKELEEDLRSTFRKVSQSVRSFPGCYHVSLWMMSSSTLPYASLPEDADALAITVSLWISEEALERYRNSPTFARNWEQLRPLVKGKPRAWTFYLQETTECP